MENRAKPSFFKGKKPFLVLVLAILVAPIVYRMGRVNLYSVQILHERSGRPVEWLKMEEPPTGHRRAAVWQAQDALGTGDTATAHAMLQPLVQEGDPLAISVEGDVLLTEGRFEAAVDHYDRAGDYQSLIEAGDAAFKNRDYPSALLAYQRANRFNEEEMVSKYADALRLTEGEPAAEAVLRIAIDKYPRYYSQPAWRYSLGADLRTEGKFSEAEEVYLEAIGLYPSDIYLVIGLGWVYADLGEMDRAAHQFETAIKMQPGQGDGYMQMGYLLRTQKKYAEADPWYEQAIHLDPQHPDWYRERGIVALAAGNPQLAIEVYQACLERFPDNRLAKLELPWAFYKAGNIQFAGRLMEQASSGQMDLRLIDWLRAGIIFEEAGMADLAINAYQHALEMEAGNSSALSGLNRLNPN